MVVGSINADLVVKLQRHPEPGETVLGRSMVVLPGGKGANQAVAAARCGARVTMIGAVGQDSHADIALSNLVSVKADIDAVRRVDVSTGMAVVEVSDGGENTIVVLPGAHAAVTAEVVRASADLVAAAPLLVLQGEIPVDATAEAVRAKRGGRVLLNLVPVVELDRDILLRADPLVVNQTEGLLVLGQMGVYSSVVMIDGRVDYRLVVESLIDCGFTSVVLTIGASGALVFGRGEVAHLQAPAVPVVDTTGAGDAFGGCLAAGLAAGAPMLEATSAAVSAGANAIRFPGAQRCR
ncbi:ribokinase [Arthrobacter sp. H41]|uniref:ribokinase n=1 Tax=Arthrobacter sp. H41 TaxID=1312978 RepID=UPI001C1DF712|nr:ribokinase [Arthrobacter sp. H41]